MSETDPDQPPLPPDDVVLLTPERDCPAPVVTILVPTLNEERTVLDDETARAIAARGAFLTPTLCCTRMPQWMRDHSFTEDQVDRAMAVGPQHLDSIKRAVDAGITLINGTDYPPGEPGDGTVVAVREMEFMAEAGLDPAAALRTATVNAARLIQAENELGQVKPGGSVLAAELDGKAPPK